MTNYHQLSEGVLKRITPIGVFLLLVYGSFVYSYYICWREIHRYHSKSTGIGLIIGDKLLIGVIYFIWVQMFTVGPGVQPHMPIYKFYEDNRDDYRSVPPPDYFICTEDGYPIYCSMCQSIKIDRSHHSRDVGSCVGRFDHFCYWIGTLIGRKNYRLFMQFLVWFQFYFIYILISSSIFMKDIYHRRNGSLHPNIIVLYILTGFWLILVFALFTSHIYYIWINITSVEEIKTKTMRKLKTPDPQAFINFKYDNERYIIRYRSLQDKIWNRGFKENWIQVMGRSFLFWIIPWGSPIKDPIDNGSNNYYELVGDYNEELGDNFKEGFIESIKRGDYVGKFGSRTFVAVEDKPENLSRLLW